MGLVIALTFTVGALSLLVMCLSYCSRLEIIKGMSKVLGIAFATFYLSVWLSSYDESNLKVGESHVNRYRVFQTRTELMQSYFGVNGSPGEDDENGCFFISSNGKVVALKLREFGLEDYGWINAMARYVVEDTVLVKAEPLYFDVQVKKHREYLEVFDYRLGKTTIIYRNVF